MAAPRTRNNQYAEASRFPTEKRVAAAREGIGLLLLGLAVFVTLALLSFHRGDPSFNHIGGTLTRNLAGKSGAILADALFQFMGISAFILPLLCAFWGWHMVRNRPINFFWDRWIALPVLIWSLSMLVARFAPAAVTTWLPAGGGGLVGKLGLAMMHRHFGVWGTLALITPLCFLAFMVLTHLSVASIFTGLGRVVGGLGALMPKGENRQPPPVKVAVLEAPPGTTKALPAPPMPAAPAVEDWQVSPVESAVSHAKPTSWRRKLVLGLRALAVGVWQLFFGESKSDRPRQIDRLEPEIDDQMDIPDALDLSLDGLEPWSPEDAVKPRQIPSPATQKTTVDPFHIPEVQLRSPPTPTVATIVTPQPPLPFEEEFFPARQQEENLVEDHEDVDERTIVASGEDEEEDEDEEWSEEALALVNKPVGPPPAAIIRPMAPRPTPAAIPRPEPNSLPPMALLDPGDHEQTQQDPVALQQHARLIEQKLADFSVKGNIADILPGPVVTTFELNPAPGLKASKVVGLSDDLARSISATSVRVVGNIPGKSVIGIEVPNLKRQTVWLRRILESPAMVNHKSPLAVALGADITGGPFVGDLAKMPHLLVAGTTGSGKSVAVNAMICTILFRCRPDQVQFLMVDPKMLELSIYEGIPHLLAPVVTEVKKAATLLKWAVSEMEDRYRLMSEMGVRNLAGFNAKIDECLANDTQLTRRVKAGFDPDTGAIVERDEPIPLEHKPLIVIVIDELADLMMQVGKDVEPCIARLAQMARAAGLHLILATQRPSVDVITGLIKANFPTRLAFQVSSRIDSRTILDAQGAEHLLGMGDGLFQPPGTSRMVRIHAPFVADHEVHNLVDFLKLTGKPRYNPAILSFRGDEDDGGGEESEEDEYDELYDQSVALVIRSRKASTSMVQRQFKIGYNRAARIVERMAREGLVSEANSAGKREVLVPNNAE